MDNFQRQASLMCDRVMRKKTHRVMVSFFFLKYREKIRRENKAAAVTTDLSGEGEPTVKRVKLKDVYG